MAERNQELMVYSHPISGRLPDAHSCAHLLVRPNPIRFYRVSAWRKNCAISTLTRAPRLACINPEKPTDSTNASEATCL